MSELVLGVQMKHHKLGLEDWTRISQRAAAAAEAALQQGLLGEQVGQRDSSPAGVFRFRQAGLLPTAHSCLTSAYKKGLQLLLLLPLLLRLLLPALLLLRGRTKHISNPAC